MHIDAGTRIFSSPDGVPWGTVVDEHPVEISIGPDPGWAKVTFVDGVYKSGARLVCDDLDFAWIPRSAVHFLAPDPPLESPGAKVSKGAPMITPRSVHTATLLRDGRVAIIGGDFQRVPLPIVEFYDPKTDRWSSGPPMRFARSGHTATLLRDGTVLVLGGCDDSHGEIFDPAKNAWHTTSAAAEPLKGHTSTLLRDGTVLVVTDEIVVPEKGRLPRRIPSHRTSIYDPAHDTWRDAGDLEQSRSSHSATLLADGRVLIAGGFNEDRRSWYFAGDDAVSEIYDPIAGGWSRAAALPGARDGHAAALLRDGRVLATGGFEDSGMDYVVLTGDALVFDPRTGSWTTEGTIDPETNRFTRTHVRPTQRPVITRCDHHLVSLADGRVLLLGGGAEYPYNVEDAPRYGASRVLIYDPTHASWTYAGDLGTGRSQETTTLLADGTVLIIGGEATHWAGTTAPTGESNASDERRRWRMAPDGVVLRYRPPPK
jgi:N-acetylneuraminic acid mutarotase